MTQTTNIGLKKIDGSENWRQIFDYHNDSADKTDSSVAAVQDGLAIVANGDTHSAVAEGQFVYVRNHSTLAEGLYKASSAIGTNAALSTSNLTADGSGGLNDLQEQVTSLNSNLEKRAKVLELGSFSSAVEMVNYFKQLTTNVEYRSIPLFKYVYINSPGEPLLFGTSSFIVLATLSSANYGSLLCISDNRASGGVKNICIAGSKAYIEAFTQTETEITLS